MLKQPHAAQVVQLRYFKICLDHYKMLLWCLYYRKSSDCLQIKGFQKSEVSLNKLITVVASD